MQFYRSQAYNLEGELRVARPTMYKADQRIAVLEDQNLALRDENKVLRKRVAELTGKLARSPQQVPAFVKANRLRPRGKGPRRKRGQV